MINELTNATRKALASLASAKGRREQGLFMAQGTKCVFDTIGHFPLRGLLATAAWQAEHPELNALVVKPSDLERISTLSTPPQVIAVYELPQRQPEPIDPSALIVALDRVQDPGNLGTIMRVADWMGVDRILASEDTADVWNPKVVQATMGAIARVRVDYVPLPSFLRENCPEGMPIFGTFLDGENIYAKSLPANGIIVMGNEGQGISPQVEACVSERLFIPSYPPERPTSESLNVAIATAITLAEFRRPKTITR